MEMKNYYKILGVEKFASSKEIKEAYYKLMRKYHPDINPFKKILPNKYHEIVEAYSILGDLDNRLHYSIIMGQKSSYRAGLVRKYNLPISLKN